MSENNVRCEKWIKREYINSPDNFVNYKVILPKANGSGVLGEPLSTPLIGKPYYGHTQTFISVGSFNSYDEADACIKYIKSKFARTMLGILKVTQDNKKEAWRKVPLQDFTSNSDIDWSQSIENIDQQLYKKYNLSQDEIDFIESKVRAMD